jgi:hypothetical protein
MRNKRELTERLVDLIPEGDRPNIDEAMIHWWYNIRDGGGLRLTPLGYQVLSEELEIESWTVPLPSNINKKLLLDLDHKLTFPYYLERQRKKEQRRIVFFSSKEAMLANLYGDLLTFLKSYA